MQDFNEIRFNFFSVVHISIIHLVLPEKRQIVNVYMECSARHAGHKADGDQEADKLSTALRKAGDSFATFRWANRHLRGVQFN